MSSRELLEQITLQLDELEPRHVYELRSRVDRLADELELEELAKVEREAVTAAAIADDLARPDDIERREDVGQ